MLFRPSIVFVRLYSSNRPYCEAPSNDKQMSMHYNDDIERTRDWPLDSVLVSK